MNKEQELKMWEIISSWRRINGQYQLGDVIGVGTECYRAALEDRQEINKLRKALEFYGDKNQYAADDVVDGVEVLKICEDQGKRARQALGEEFKDSEGRK